MPRPAPQKSPDTFVEAFARGLRVLRAFELEQPELSLSQAAARAGLTRAGARRLLLTLVSLGYATVQDKRFRLTPQVLLLADAYLRSSGLPALAMPVLQRVSQQLGESCSLAVLDGSEVVYVARVALRRIMTVNLAVGSRLPALWTSMGRVLLAHAPQASAQVLATAELTARTERTLTSRPRLKAALARAHAQGYAVVDQELEAGLRSIAVPVVNAAGQVVAAMNVSGQANRVTLEQLRKKFLPVLEAAARELGAQLT